MNKTENLKKYLYKELKEITDNVFYQQANDTAKFPYIVYSLTSKPNECWLELNIWDRSQNSIQVEALADQVEKNLDNSYHYTDDFSLTIDLNTRNFIGDTDKSLKRERLLFFIKIYYKE